MKKNLKIKIIVILFIVLMIFLIYTKFKNDNSNNNILAEKINLMFKNIDKSNTVKVDKYIIYGTHLNIEGKITIPKVSKISVDSAHIVINDTENEVVLNTNFEYSDSILSFSTIENLNDGISLEKLSAKNYYVFLKVVLSSSEVFYYSLENATKYNNITYYSITKNNSNEKIDIKFDKYNEIPFFTLHCTNIDTLPQNVYDIVIDASHGGKDNGAVKGKVTEAELVLNNAITLKKKLEEKGLKVFLTRDGTEPKDSDMSMNMYDENGRINIAQEANAKFLISLNINDAKSKKGGIEVYAPTNCNLSFAKLLADNIVKTANATYSSSNLYKKENGIYVRGFSNSDIQVFQERAKKGNYEPYNITNSTPYLYMIREIGGIATNAFIDGRNKNYGKNKYFDSNVGIEGYSIELGYMSVESDLNNIIDNGNLYMDGIANAIFEQIGQ